MFDVEVTYYSTSFNKVLLKGPDLLNNLVGVLLCFCLAFYVVMGDIKQIFHHIFVESKGVDVLCFFMGR